MVSTHWLNLAVRHVVLVLNRLGRHWVLLGLHRVSLTLHRVLHWNTNCTPIYHLMLFSDIHQWGLTHWLSVSVHRWIPVFSFRVVIVLFVVHNWLALSQLSISLAKVVLIFALFAQATAQDYSYNGGDYATHHNSYDHSDKCLIVVVSEDTFSINGLAEFTVFVGCNCILVRIR